MRNISLTPILLLMVTWAWSTDYHVSPSGNDSYPGSSIKPWRNIQHAADTLVAGDRVYIRSGTYYEQVITQRSGNVGSGHIVFSNYPGEQPVIDGTGVSTGNNGFIIAHSYIKLSGLNIRNWNDNGIWMEGAGQVEINDCVVYQVTYGIGASDGTHDFVLNQVTMHHFDFYGFDASPAGGADCYNGTFNDCIAYSGRDTSQNVDGFALGHGTQHDFVFNRCEAYDVFDGFDISARNTTLNRCTAHDCWNGGYKLWQDKVTLYNCLGYHSGSANVELDWDGSPGTTTLQNCTFVDAQLYNIWVENSGDSLHLYNCILAGGDNIGLAFEQMGVQYYKGDYNVFHNDNSNRAIAVAYTDEFTLNQISTGAWTTYSGQDSHSLVATNPNTELFVNLSSWDLHLRAGSIAIDAGIATNAPSVDYDGNSRPEGNGYDIGAYEFRSAKNDFNYDGQGDFLWRHYGTGGNALWYLEFTGTIASLNQGKDKNTLLDRSQKRIRIYKDVYEAGKLLYKDERVYHDILDIMVPSEKTPEKTYKDAIEIGDALYLPREEEKNGDVMRLMESEGREAGVQAISVVGTEYLVTITDTNWKIGATGDFNLDGRVDILWRHYGTGANAIWYMDGSIIAGAAYLATITDVNWRIEGAGDFNGDGNMDILWRHSVTGKNALWYMNGSTYINTVYLATVTNLQWEIGGTGDFNLDGNVDILWRNYSHGANAVWYMSGSTLAGSAYLLTITDVNWRIEGAGDFNLDGNIDILWRNYSHGANAVWYMNGSTITGAEYLITVADTNWKIENH